MSFFKTTITKSISFAFYANNKIIIRIEEIPDINALRLLKIAEIMFYGDVFLVVK